MDSKMNPNFPKQRGCFLDKSTPDKVIVVDYPTWSSKNSGFTFGDLNTPIPDGQPFEQEFKTVAEAQAFAADNNYIVCNDPWSKTRFEPKRVAREDDEIEY